MIDRREFISTGLAALGTLAFSRQFSLAADPAEKTRVWAASGHPKEAAQSLIKAVGGLESHIPENGLVVIKPNIAFPAPPQWGATTDPEFLAEIIDQCLAAGAKRVIVVDHPVGSSAQKNLDRSGIGAVCEARDAVQILIGGEERQYLPVEVPRGIALKQTQIIKIIDKADLFINLPTAKHHSATGVSLGLKNLMGLIWDRVVFHEQVDLDQAIADLATVLRPTITFLDCRYALLTGGPTGPGQVSELNRYLAGFDPVAVDSIGVSLARWENRIQQGSHIRHLSYAQQMGLGELDAAKIDVIEI